MKKSLLPVLLLAAMQLFALNSLCGSVAETASQDRPNIVLFIDGIDLIRFPEKANELISEWGKLNQQMVEPLF